MTRAKNQLYILIPGSGALTTGELSQVLSHTIPDTTRNDQDRTEVDCGFASKSLTQVVSNETEDDGGEEKGSGNNTQSSACGTAKVAGD